VTPTARRAGVQVLIQDGGLSQRRACGLIGMSRSSARYQHRSQEAPPLSARLRQLAEERPRFGYRRLGALLRREGAVVNHKRVYRWYRAAGLALRPRRCKHVSGAARPIRLPLFRANERWSLDFMADRLATGRPFRTLNIVDDWSRECLVIEVDTSLPGARVVRVLEQLRRSRGTPQRIVLDNGPELTSQVVDRWAATHDVILEFIEPGKPIQNAYVESFNGKFRDECLDQHWFASVAEARHLIEAWRQDYNQQRPHSALGYATPEEFAYALNSHPIAQSHEGLS